MRQRLVQILMLAGAALVAAACTTAMVSSQHDKKPAGPAIQFGQGHFSKDAKAFHYWDKEPAIPPVCAKCHAADGLATFLRDGKNPAAPHVKGYGFACTNCHADAQTFALREAPKVTFASGAVVDTGDRAANVCMQCHQGRESTASVNRAIAGRPADAPDAKLNQKLAAWWELDFTGFLAQVRAGLKREIPVRQRDDWEEWLAAQRGEHEQRTAEIVRLETQLNSRVYDLFDLKPAEVKVIEESTKYRYGEV